ncbi:ParB/RepB/Spo0J family partition protein [Rhabdothermincola salaria]|uniref:ParB/RepB/Spo0J family partition protein n=1 Tax=Rhabdothermincola salaria TaxID=2903142 RepID=UPI001E451E9A|nr:ParB/RepB/Spo0J family partition protein [Rhabdothermincola salaria]
MGRRSGLGKGLGALIPTTATVEEEAQLHELPISQIEPNRYQPREYFDEEQLVSLAASIRAVGVLQPVLVRPAGPERYELIAGERRWRAARRAGLQTIPALVRQTEDVRSLEHALVENLHRADLNPLEEAAAYQQLIEEFDHTQEEVATRVGKSRSAVANTLRLLHLPATIQRLVQDGQLSAGHARALLGTPDRQFQEALAQRAVAERLTVRDVEEEVRRHQTETDDPATPPPTKAPAPVRPAAVLELEEMLANLLDTRVQVSVGAKRGRLVVEFATLEDLERIYRVMAEGPEGDGA